MFDIVSCLAALWTLMEMCMCFWMRVLTTYNTVLANFESLQARDHSTVRKFLNMASVDLLTAYVGSRFFKQVYFSGEKFSSKFLSQFSYELPLTKRHQVVIYNQLWGSGKIHI